MNLTWLLFSFQGRIHRRPFWAFVLAMAALLPGGAALIARAADLPFSVGVDLAVMILLLPALAVQTKRWHDRNKSAWWLLVNLVPIVGPIWVLVECGAFDGTPGANAYGDDPLGRAADRNGPAAPLRSE